MMSFFNTYKQHLFLVGILLLAAFMRLYDIAGYMTFLGDEGRDVIIVRDILHGHLTLLGPRTSAADFYTGPLYYYMMAPFLLLFNYDPVGPAVMIGILGVVTVWLMYFIAKKFLGTFAAVVATLLYAVSPWVVTYSHSSWNPNPMPIFTLTTLYTLYQATIKQSTKLFFLTGILYGLSLQLHYIETFVGVIIFVFILLASFFGKHLHPKLEKDLNLALQQKLYLLVKQYVVLFAGFLIGMSPFLIFELRHQFANTKTIIQFIFYGSPNAAGVTHDTFLQIISSVFFNFFGHLIFNFPLPDFAHYYPSSILPIWAGVVIFFSVCAIASIYFIKDRLFAFLLLLWIILGIGLFGFYHKPIHDYYFEFMFPLPFLLFGNLFQVCAQNKKIPQVFSLLAMMLIAFQFTFLLSGSPFHLGSNRQKEQTKIIAQFVIDKTNHQPYNFALVSPGNSDHAYRYYLDILGDPPVVIQNTMKDEKRTSVMNQLLVVCEGNRDCKPLGKSEFEIAGFGRAEIVGQWDVSVVRIMKLVPYTGN